MHRNIVCRIRLLVDNLPIKIRNSRWLFEIAKIVFKLPKELYTFREDYKNGRIVNLDSLYLKGCKMELKRSSKDTDINSLHLDLIDKYIHAERQSEIIDIGCGTGFLIQLLSEKNQHCQFLGIDFNLPDLYKKVKSKNINYIAGDVNSEIRDIPEKSFDIVICTHFLEHIKKPNELIIELRRIVRRKLIIIVPLEKPYKWGLNYHINFFPTPKSFLDFVRSDDNASINYHSYERLV